MTLKYHFFNYRTVFPVQKVSFLAAKIPMGRKSFLSLSARKKRKRYRRKKCPIIKKDPFFWCSLYFLCCYQNHLFLTTERSEVVPFFRAVRAEKRGREATPQGGGGAPSPRGWAKPTHLPLGRSPLPQGQNTFQNL